MTTSHQLHRAWPPLFVLTLSLLVTAGASLYVGKTAATRDRRQFNSAVEASVDAISERMETYIDTLRGVRGLFAAAGRVGREEFRSYVEHLEIRGRYPGIQGVGYSARLPPGSAASVAERMRREGFPDFSVWSDPGWPSPAPEQHAILYLEPMDSRNRAAIGFNMYAGPIRRAAMNRARDTGRASASGRVTLVQEITESKQAGFLIYLPVYRNGRLPASVEERRRALLGFVYSPFRGDDLLEGIFGSQEDAPLTFAVYDGTDARPELLLHHSGAARTLPSRPGFQESRRIEVAGRTWTLAFAPQPGLYFPPAGLAAIVFAGGLLVSLLLYGITSSQASARCAAERMAADVSASEEALRRANQAKDEFLAMLGHELRNPLSAVSNALGVLRVRLAGEASVTHLLEVAVRQVRHQTRLVDDLLDVSRVTSGKITLRSEATDMRAVAERSLEAIRAAVPEQRHAVALHAGPEPVLVYGDPARLEQVVTNLVGNAIKYTPPGGAIDVRVEAENAGSREAAAVLRVRDSGIGIPADMLPCVFDLFTQVQNGVQRSEGGLGLGLTLVKSLVQMHRGSVSVTSPGIGRGTEFTVRLPLAAGAAAPPPPAAPADGRPHAPLRLLVVEDNADARNTLVELLETWGHQVEAAETGPAGLRKALEGPFDIALVDVGLPGLDGYEVARQIRAEAGRELCLLAVTGYGQPDDRRQALAAGFDDHLVKPVDPERLERVLARCLAR